MNKIRQIQVMLVILLTSLSLNTYGFINNKVSIDDTSKMEIVKTKVLVGSDTCDKISTLKPLDSIPEIFRTVLPQVAFFLEKSSVSCILGEGMNKWHLKFRYNNQYYWPNLSFNSLIDKMKYEDEIKIEDIIIAYLSYMNYMDSDRFCSIKILSLKKCNVNIDTIYPQFNYALSVMIDNYKSNMYLFIFNNRVYLVAKETDGKFAFADKRRYKVYGIEGLPYNYRKE